MPLQPVKDMNEYKRIKDTLRERFEAERTGDQDLFREQTKTLQPLINTQQQTIKAIKDGRDSSATALTDALVPLARELQRKNDQAEHLMPQQVYSKDVAAITPALSEFMNVDLDAGLSETDKENLDVMQFDLPSVVFTNKTIDGTIERIKSENRSIGQKLGTGPVGKKLTQREKDIFESQKQTLRTYKEKIKALRGARQFASTPIKAGTGVDVIYYPNVGDLCNKLSQLHLAKQAGNNGLDNNINSILDELLSIKAVDKDEYNTLHKNIFGNIECL